MSKVLQLRIKDKSGKEVDSGRMEIKNLSSKSAELYFYGDIVSSTWDKWMSEDTCPQDVTDFLKELDGSENISIYVNSGGGDVFAGISIYNTLKRHQAKKTVYVDGLAASIASVIALAGDTVIIPSSAQFMIHKPWSWTYGNANDFRKFAETLDSVEESIINVYKDHLKEGVDIETIRQMVNDETWLTGDKAAEYFNVQISEEAPIAACADSEYFSKYKNVPKNLLNMSSKPNLKGMGSSEECVCSSCNHSENCQSSGAKCCICGNCSMASKCSKPGAAGCNCNACTMAQNNCCQPGEDNCMCDTCTNQDCKKGNMDKGGQMGAMAKSIELLKAKLALECEL